MQSLTVRLQRKDVILRIVLLAASFLLALLLANVAASLLEVWQLDPGAAVPAPWDGVFDASRATQRSNSLALMGLALVGGAALACLVFFLERIARSLWSWLQDAIRK